MAMRMRVPLGLGAGLLTLLLVWALVLGWWQANDVQPGARDLALYLLLLPLALLGGYGLLRGFIGHLQAPTAPAAQVRDPARDPGVPSREDRLSLNLLGATLASAPGRSADAILDALAAGHRPGLDPVLRDEAGFPIFTARVTDLDPAAFTAQPANAGLPPAFREGEARRALALLAGILPELLDQAGEHLGPRPEGARVRLHWLVPARWATAHHPDLARWLAGLLPARLPTVIELHPVVAEADGLQALDRLVLAAGDAAGNPDLLLLCAADSHVGETSVADWQARGRLFGPARPAGQVPGEGAVALLLASGPGPLRISRTSLGEAAAPPPAGRGVGATVAGLLGQRLAAWGAPAEDMQALVADGDHRQPGVAELMQALGSLLDDRDPAELCLRLGTACGTPGAAGDLLTVAVAAARARPGSGPVACLSNQHPHRRAVLLVGHTPTTSPQPDAPQGSSVTAQSSKS